MLRKEIVYPLADAYQGGTREHVDALQRIAEIMGLQVDRKHSRELTIDEIRGW